MNDSMLMTVPSATELLDELSDNPKRPASVTFFPIETPDLDYSLDTGADRMSESQHA